MYSDDLKGLFDVNPNLTGVWIDADGNWYIAETENCNFVAKEDILKSTKKAKVNE